MENRTEIINKLKAAVAGIAKKRDLKMVILYGSLAKGKTKPDSDVDIAVLGNNLLTMDNIIEIIDDFSAELAINDIDVKSLHRVDPLFRYQVTKDGILLYGNERDFMSFKIYAFRDYVDSASLFRLKEFLVKKRLRLTSK